MATTSTATSDQRPTKRFRTLSDAVKAVASQVDVPVVLPRNLPKGTKLAGAGITNNRAYITVRSPGRRVLTIQYGIAGFDGCGPGDPRPVTVGSVPGVIQTGKHSKRPYTTLIWPATLKGLRGRYGLSGELSAARIMSFAESMQRARVATPRGRKPSC